MFEFLSCQFNKVVDSEFFPINLLIGIYCVLGLVLIVMTAIYYPELLVEMWESWKEIRFR